MFKITGSGLKPCESLSVYPNTEAYMGASDSPNHIVITRVTDRAIYYKSGRYYDKEWQEDRRIGEDLIKTGIETMLDKSWFVEHNPETAENFRKMLNGEEPGTVDVSEFETVKVSVAPTDGDPHAVWREAKAYGVMCGFNEATGKFTVEVSRHHVSEIEAMDCFTDVEVAEMPEDEKRRPVR